MTVVALAGDWHGNSRFATGRLMSLGSRGIKTCLHLGDAGIWPGPSGKRYLAEVEKVCARYGIRLYITPGNHEDWPMLIDRQRPEMLEERDELGPMIWLTDHIAVHPRDPAGHRFTLGGRSFVSLGGAPSIDYPSRREGATWWPDEMIPQATAEAVAADGYADVMLTHDAPGAPWMTRKVRIIVEEDPDESGWGWSDQGLAWAKVGRDRMTLAFEGVRPRLLAHGHFHVSDEITVRLPGCDYDTTILSLPHEGGHDKNMRLLDLDTLEVL